MNWYGIMKILEVSHHNKNGALLWHSSNIRNVLHQEGEEFILRAVFTGGQVSTIIPENYYLGLDNRTVVDVTDTLDNIFGEPAAGGYERQEVSSSGDFTVILEDDNFVASSPIVSFRATTATWGPVSNLFLADSADNSGRLISTATLASSITVSLGDNVTMRIGMQLRDCLDGT
jgi:hypothetical protein